MSNWLGQRPYQVLLVEDNPGDVRLEMEVLRACAAPVEIHVAEDGVVALEMLHGAGGRPPLIPDLVLLDLNLPRKTGHEVLAEIRADRNLALTPVVVFTSSSAEPDVRKAYENHANCFLTKPSGFDNLMETIRQIEEFWLSRVSLPTRAGSPD